MLLGFYSGVSGLLYNEQKLSVTASNMANVDTAGFRRSLMLLSTRQEHDQTKHIDRDVRSRVPNFYGIQRHGIHKIYGESGSIKKTDSKMDIAIPPELKNAFFQVKIPTDQGEEVYYTRNGTMKIGPENPNNPDSDPVLYLGESVALDDSGAPISINPTGGPLNISSAGVVQQGDAILGTIPIFRLNKSPDQNTNIPANLQQLLQMGDSLYAIPEDAKNEFFPKQLVVGEDGVYRTVLQGFQEGSNVNSVEELLFMMEASKGYSSNIGAIKTQMDGLSKLFQQIRS